MLVLCVYVVFIVGVSAASYAAIEIACKTSPKFKKAFDRMVGEE